MSLITPGRDPLAVARERVEMLRRLAHEGDIRGHVGGLLAILSENCLSLNATGTTKEELASLIRFGLLAAVRAHIETAMTLEVCGQPVSDDLVAKALEMAHAAASLFGSIPEDDLQQIPHLMRITQHAVTFVDAHLGEVPEDEGSVLTAGVIIR